MISHPGHGIFLVFQQLLIHCRLAFWWFLVLSAIVSVFLLDCGSDTLYHALYTIVCTVDLDL